MPSHENRQTFLSGLSGNDFTSHVHTILLRHMASTSYHCYFSMINEFYFWPSDWIGQNFSWRPILT